MDPCPFGECDGTGFVYDEAHDVARDCRCRAQRKAARRARGLSHHIPRRYRDVGFERHPVSEMDRHAVARVRAYCASIGERIDRGEGLAFFGERGTGKTTLAMLVSQHALRASRSVAIYTAPALLAAIKGTYDEDSEDSYVGFMERLASVDLLHVEDLAVARQTDWILEQLYTVVNRRYEDQKAILFTSDVPMLKLPEHVGGRTVSRLIEMCAETIFLEGQDHRLLKAGVSG